MAKKPADCFAAPEKAKCPVAPLPGKTRTKDRNIRGNRFFPESRKTRLIESVPCSSGSQAGERRIDSPIRPMQAPGNRTTKQKKKVAKRMETCRPVQKENAALAKPRMGFSIGSGFRGNRPSSPRRFILIRTLPFFQALFAGSAGKKSAGNSRETINFHKFLAFI